MNRLKPKNNTEHYFITPKPDHAHEIFTILEEKNWAPFLAASADTIAGRIKIFPQGQIVLAQDKTVHQPIPIINRYMPLASHIAYSHIQQQELIGYLSLNRIDRDGNVESLTSWDAIAGEPTTYANTYNPAGNTLVMMSMDVHPNYQGKGIPNIVIEQAKELARTLNIQHIISSFRPSTYGTHKLQYGDPGFEIYVDMKKNEYPLDAWLRVLAKNGMQQLGIAEKSMCVQISLGEFQQLQQTYKPDVRKQSSPNVWECGETGSRHIQGDTATYIEHNVRGKIPL